MDEDPNRRSDFKQCGVPQSFVIDFAGTETEDKIQKRLTNAVGEMEAARGLEWDGWIVNDDVDKAYTQLRELTQGARRQRAQALALAAGHKQ